MVCTGDEPLSPPRSSLRPPRALRLDRALSAPGLASSCAKGIAEARGELELAGPLELEPGLLFPGVEEFWASRFAFCSSTLEEHTQKEKKRMAVGCWNRINTK